jgi:hypothetical protein
MSSKPTKRKAYHSNDKGNEALQGDAYYEDAILRMGDCISLLYSETPAEGGILIMLPPLHFPLLFLLFSFFFLLSFTFYLLPFNCYVSPSFTSRFPFPFPLSLPAPPISPLFQLSPASLFILLSSPVQQLD